MNPGAIGFYLMFAILMVGAISLGPLAIYIVGGLTVLYTLWAVS